MYIRLLSALLLPLGFSLMGMGTDAPNNTPPIDGILNVDHMLFEQFIAIIELKEIVGQTALTLAAREEYTEAVHDLIALGADVNAKNLHGTTPLIIASINGHITIVKALIDAHANVNVADKEGATPLLEASRRGHLAIAQVLIQAGANINAHNSCHVTLLMEAVQQRATELVKVYIDAAADVNAQDTEGKNALIYAILTQQVAIVNDLIAAGAEVNKVDRSGKNALMAIKISKYDQFNSYNQDNQQNIRMAQALIAAGSRFDATHEMYANYARFNDRVQELYNCSRAAFSFSTVADYTQKHAQEVAQLHKLNELIKTHQLRLDFIDPHGYTLLHYALLSSNRVMIGLLLHLMIKYQQFDALDYRSRKEKQTPIQMATTKGAAWLLQPFSEILHRQTN